MNYSSATTPWVSDALYNSNLSIPETGEAPSRPVTDSLAPVPTIRAQAGKLSGSPAQGPSPCWRTSGADGGDRTRTGNARGILSLFARGLVSPCRNKKNVTHSCMLLILKAQSLTLQDMGGH